MSLSDLAQKLQIAQVLKAAVMDARADEPATPKIKNFDDALAHWKKNLRTSPCTCYTHKLQFKNRREFRLHIKYQHSTQHI